MTKILTVTNQKGGVWKTATAVNLAAAFSAQGERVLLVDMDPSGDLTAHCGIDLQDGDATVFEVLTQGRPIKEAVKHLERETTGTAYDIVPADAALSELQPGTPAALRDALQTVSGEYDRVIIDTAPSVSAPTVAAIAAADGVIIPAMPHYLSLAAIQAVQNTVEDVRSETGANPRVLGVLWTNYSPRSTHNREIAGALDESQPGAAFETTISPAIGTAEAAAEGVDLLEYIARTPRRRHTRTAEQYKRLAAEIREKEAQ